MPDLMPDLMSDMRLFVRNFYGIVYSYVSVHSLITILLFIDIGHWLCSHRF